MKKLIVFIMAILCINMVSAVQLPGFGIDLDIEIEEFEPNIWLCDYGIIQDDVNPDITRINNYAFQGERIDLFVLTHDRNGDRDIGDVVMIVGRTDGIGRDIEAECQEVDGPARIPDKCNARVGEEILTEFNENSMDYYECVLTVETPASMYGEYFSTVEVVSIDGEAHLDEAVFWFFNPELRFSVGGNGQLFDSLMPGETSYSNPIMITNNAHSDSGVMLNLFMTGTDIYDIESSGSRCPTDNYISLDNIRYYATNGAYSTMDDLETDLINNDRNKDEEGYISIEYEDASNDLHNNAEIMQVLWDRTNNLYLANLLAPGAEMVLTLKLNVPEPCTGSFNRGGTIIWAETV